MLEWRNVSFAYDAQVAVRDVSLRAEAGHLIALTGQNGSGKSTLLKLAARVISARSGDVIFDNRSLREWDRRGYARQVAYLPQEPETAFPMRALDVVVSGRAPYLGRFSWEAEADFTVAREALAMCDAAHLADRYLDEMSGGERKRVFLARVLAGKPKLILLDEPLSALDIAHVQQFSRLMRQVVDSTGATVIFASHDLNWAAAYSDRIVVMKRGEVAADGAPSSLLSADLVRDLFGFDARVVNEAGRNWLLPM
jgi:iron complex transport system ATP-binding protein